jgi:hypothetical protein
MAQLTPLGLIKIMAQVTAIMVISILGSAVAGLILDRMLATSPLLVLVKFHKGTKTLTGFFTTFYARRSSAFLRFPKSAHVYLANFGGLIPTVSCNPNRTSLI